MPYRPVSSGRRQLAAGGRSWLGPHFALRSAPGHKSTLFLGVRGWWRYRPDATIRLTVGPKLAEASTAALASHIDSVAVAWELDVEIYRGFFVIWSHDRYGTGASHLGFGYRFQRRERGERALAAHRGRR